MLKAPSIFMLAASLLLCYLVQGTYAQERTLVLDLSGEGSCFDSIYSHAGQDGRMTMDEFKLLVTYLGGNRNHGRFEDIFNELTGPFCNHFFNDEAGTCDSQTVPYFGGSRRSISETIYLFKVCEQTQLEIMNPTDPTSSPSSSPIGITASPTSSPTAIPSATPSLRPTKSPTPAPTPLPSPSPSSQPTGKNIPSASPSVSIEPSASPSSSPKPSGTPTVSPTVSVKPSVKPSPSPSMSPTVSSLPSLSPSVSALPSATPSSSPTSTPTPVPTRGPLSPGAVAAISVGSVVAGSAFLYFLLGGLCLAACRRRSNARKNPVEVNFPLSIPSESEAILSDAEVMNSISHHSHISVGSQSHVSEAEPEAGGGESESESDLSKD